MLTVLAELVTTDVEMRVDARHPSGNLLRNAAPAVLCRLCREHVTLPDAVFDASSTAQVLRRGHGRGSVS
jgi:hypothetical protein